MAPAEGSGGDLSRRVYFITHPDVVIDPSVPVPAWPLSARGRSRMQRLLACPWLAEVDAIYASTERKAVDGATILAEARGLPVRQDAALGENDRSATGFLPPAEFAATADAFFARPGESIRGWERAADAQSRIVAATARIARSAPGDGPIAVVSHGGVGALLLCHLKRVPISRREEQPGTTGGHYFVFEATAGVLVHGWTPIDG